MIPNPVCYNVLSVPEKAVHISRKLSLGTLPHDYRADTAQNWRIGISPNGGIGPTVGGGPDSPYNSGIVVYSDTYSKGLGIESNAVPRIWWIDNSTGTTDADFKAKVIEIASRLPERAANNYEIFSSYTDAVDFLDTNNYTLIADDYPEYYYSNKCMLNLELGYWPTNNGNSTYKLFNLANPTNSIGYPGSAVPAYPRDDFYWNPAGLSTLITPAWENIGQETGFQPYPDNVNGFGGIDQTSFVTSTQLQSFGGFIFESVLEIAGTGANETVFELRKAGSANGFELNYVADHFELVYSDPTNGTTTVIMQNSPAGKRHIVLRIPYTTSYVPAPVNNYNECVLYVDGSLRSVQTIIHIGGTPQTSWTVPTDQNRFKFGSTSKLGAVTSLGGPIYSIKVYTADTDRTAGAALTAAIAAKNWPIVQPLYGL